MAYVIQFYWLYFLIALAFGTIVGWMTWQTNQRPGLFQSWLGWTILLFLAGLVIAMLKVIAGRGGLYLELALLFFAIYVAGCWLGGALRSLLAPVREDLLPGSVKASATGVVPTSENGDGGKKN